MSDDRVLTVSQAAAYCGVSRSTIHRWIRNKGLHAYNTAGGMYVKIRLADLREFVAAHNILVEEEYLATLMGEEERQK